ncbi:MAG: AAA family ATPase, partial [Cellulomonadaceae bacterium]|nr:AAA family ATPase [Cellulomonadaceae bacterium]
MLTDIYLSGLPCFGANAALQDLTKVNYIYGPNGSGKTTISQALATLAPATMAMTTWKG